MAPLRCCFEHEQRQSLAIEHPDFSSATLCACCVLVNSDLFRASAPYTVRQQCGAHRTMMCRVVYSSSGGILIPTHGTSPNLGSYAMPALRCKVGAWSPSIGMLRMIYTDGAGSKSLRSKQARPQRGDEIQIEQMYPRVRQTRKPLGRKCSA